MSTYIMRGTRLPPEEDQVCCDRFIRCFGCPYPRHGLFCWTDSETCLRTEMAKIESRWEVAHI